MWVYVQILSALPVVNLRSAGSCVFYFDRPPTYQKEQKNFILNPLFVWGHLHDSNVAVFMPFVGTFSSRRHSVLSVTQLNRSLTDKPVDNELSSAGSFYCRECIKLVLLFAAAANCPLANYGKINNAPPLRFPLPLPPRRPKECGLTCDAKTTDPSVAFCC